MKIPITVIVITKNEERNIERCLESCSGADQVFVVDSESVDKTKEIAERFIPKGNVIDFKWDGGWPKKKYWSLLNLPISNEWVLLLDADERPTEKFWNEVNQKRKLEKDAYFVRFNYLFMGKLIRFGDPVRKLILFRHKKASFVKEGAEDFMGNFDFEGHSHPIIDGEIGYIKNRIIHDDYKGLYSYFERHNKYSDWEAKLKSEDQYNLKNLSGGKTVARRKKMKYFFMKLPCKGLLYFCYSYFFRLGFLDGRAGLNYNLCKAFYFFQIDLKIRELKNN